MPLIIGAAIALLAAAGAAFIVLRPGPEPTPSAAPTAATVPSDLASTSTAPTATPAATPTEEPTPAPTTPPYSGNLEDLVASPPPGMSPVTLSALTPDMSDAMQAATLWNHELAYTVASVLQGHHMQRGIVRTWRNETNVVIINLLQFEPGGNSNRWVSEANVALGSSYGSGRFPELNNAKWAQLAYDAHNWEIRTLIYKGDFVAVVYILAAESQTPDMLKAVATEQMDRLP